MNLPNQTRITYNVNGRLAISLKFGDTFRNSPTKLVIEAKAMVCTTINENLLYIG